MKTPDDDLYLLTLSQWTVHYNIQYANFNSSIALANFAFN
jgi:hypothetical protein